MGICGSKKIAKPFRPGEAAMLRMEQEEREEEERRRKEEEEYREVMLANVLGPPPKPGEIVFGPELPPDWNPGENKVENLDSKNNLDNGASAAPKLSKQESIKVDKEVKLQNKTEKDDPATLKNKKSITKKFTLTDVNTKEKLSDKSPSVPKSNDSIEQKFRLIKADTGESLPNIETPAHHVSNGKDQRIPLKQVKTKEMDEEKPLILGLTDEKGKGSFGELTPTKKLDKIPEPKPSSVPIKLSPPANAPPPVSGTTINTVITSPSAPSNQAAAQKSNSSPKNHPNSMSPKNPALLHLANDPYSNFTIKELTEPDPTHSMPPLQNPLRDPQKDMTGHPSRQSIDPKSAVQNTVKEEIIGLDSVNLLFTAGMTQNYRDKNLELLRQNEEMRNAIVGKPNFSNKLLTRELFQEMMQKKEELKLEQTNKELALQENKKYQDLFDMVRAEGYTHSQTPARLVDGWMVYEGEGEVRKDRDK